MGVDRPEAQGSGARGTQRARRSRVAGQGRRRSCWRRSSRRQRGGCRSRGSCWARPFAGRNGARGARPGARPSCRALGGDVSDPLLGVPRADDPGPSVRRGLWRLFGLEAPDLPGGGVVSFVLATAIYAYGGSVFIRSAGHELLARLPWMITLVSVGISAAYLYSVTTTFWVEGEGFYWELATLVDIMLLGHWIEMRAVGRSQ